MRYRIASPADQAIAAAATAIIGTIDAAANAVVTLETLSVGGDSGGTSADKPLRLQVVRNSGGVTSGGAAPSLRAVDEPNHTAAARATVLAGSTALTMSTAGTDEVLFDEPISPHGSTPFGVPLAMAVAKCLPGEIIILRVTNPTGNGTINVRWGGTILE